MRTTIELARLVALDRDREASRLGLRSLMQRIADCCRPASLFARLAESIHRAGDICCPTEAERLARTVRAINGC